MALTTKRLNWLKWLYPGETGLQTEQKWHLEKRQNHMSIDHLPGVSQGMRVMATSPTPNLFVHVQVGRAIDKYGAEVVVGSIVDLDLSSYASGGGTAYIVAEYADQGTDPYIVPETLASQYTYLQDAPIVTHQGVAPTGRQIEIARVVVTNGATQIADAANPDSPVSNEVDERYKDIQIPAMAGKQFPAKDYPRHGEVPAFDRVNDRWEFKPPAGWTILNPSDQTLNVRLAGAVSGQRFWLEDGVYALTANINVSAVNVTIAGSRSAVIRPGAFNLTVSGIQSKLIGFSVENHVANVSGSGLVGVSGIGSEVNGVAFYSSGAGTTTYGLSVTPSLTGIVRIHACEFTVAAASALWFSGTNTGVVIERCWVQCPIGVSSYIGVDANAFWAVIRDCVINLNTPSSGLTVGIVLRSNTLVDRCLIDGPDSNANVIGIYGAGAVSVSRVSGCRVTQCLRGMVFDNYAWWLSIDDCVIEKVAALASAPVNPAGIDFTGASSLKWVDIRNNYIDAYERGVNLGDYTMVGSHVEGNTVEVSRFRAWPTGLDLGGILWTQDQGSGDQTGNRIAGNRVKLSFDGLGSPSGAEKVYGIKVYDGNASATQNVDGLIIESNTVDIVVDVSAFAIGVVFNNGSSTAAPGSVHIDGNTIKVVCNGPSPGEPYGIFVTRGAGTTFVHGNDVYAETTSLTATAKGVSFAANASASPGTRITHNRVHIKRGTSATAATSRGIDCGTGISNGVVVGNMGLDLTTTPVTRSLAGISIAGTAVGVTCSNNVFTRTQGNWDTGVYTNTCTYSAFVGNVVASTIDATGLGSVKTGNVESY